jgi:hypothetical protein
MCITNSAYSADVPDVGQLTAPKKGQLTAPKKGQLRAPNKGHRGS